MTSCTHPHGRQQARKSALRAGGGIARKKSRGLSILGILFFVLVAYGFYTWASKPRSKAVVEEVAPAAPTELKVVIYTTSSCEPCARAKTWLTRRQITFEERNVELVSAYKGELENLKSQIVPVIVINGKPQYAFHEATLEDALKEASRPTK